MGLELTKLTCTRLEDNLIRHRGDRPDIPRLLYTAVYICLIIYHTSSITALPRRHYLYLAASSHIIAPSVASPHRHRGKLTGYRVDIRQQSGWLSSTHLIPSGKMRAGGHIIRTRPYATAKRSVAAAAVVGHGSTVLFYYDTWYIPSKHQHTTRRIPYYTMCGSMFLRPSVQELQTKHENERQARVDINKYW